MRYAILVPLLLLAGCSSNAISHRETYINARQFTPGGREPLLPKGSRLNKELNLGFNTDLYRFGYFDNKAWTMIDQGQFRTVGWNYKLGARMTDRLAVEYEHFSKHLLDHAAYSNGFPVQDSIGIVLHLYRRDKAPDSIFGAGP